MHSKIDSLKCKICNNEFLNLRKFNNHLKQEHKISPIDYNIEYNLGGVKPKCKCGYCDEMPEYRDNVFHDFAVGHKGPKWRKQNYIKKHGIPTCKTCGNNVGFTRGLPNQYCSSKCVPNGWNQETIKQNNLKKYGVECVFQLPEIQEKMKQTKKERYGDEKYNNREKAKQTCLEKFGVENAFQSEEKKQKIINNNIEKYGVEWHTQSENFKEKTKQTNLKNIGVEWPMQNKEICKKSIEKIKITNKKKYGVECVFQLPEIQEKMKQINLKNIGVEWPSQNKEIHEKQLKSAYRLKKFRDTNLFYQGQYEYDFLDKYYDLFPEIRRANSIEYIFNGENKVYHPDFYIESLNLNVEIKSTYYYNEDKDRCNAKAEAASLTKFNYIMIMDKDYTEFISLYVNIR